MRSGGYAPRAAALSYRLLLRLLPSRLRREHGAEMLATARLVFAEAWERGRVSGLLGRWLSECVDLLVTAVRLRRDSLLRPGRVRLASLRPALGVPVLALVALLFPRVEPDPRPEPAAVVVSAHDPAGEFSLTLRDGRVVAASLDRVPLPSHRLVQAGDSIRFLAEDGSLLFSVQVEHPGTIRWEARAALARS